MDEPPANQVSDFPQEISVGRAISAHATLTLCHVRLDS
jgi:hypothetical protein